MKTGTMSHPCLRASQEPAFGEALGHRNAQLFAPLISLLPINQSQGNSIEYEIKSFEDTDVHLNSIYKRKY